MNKQDEDDARAGSYAIDLANQVIDFLDEEGVSVPNGMCALVMALIMQWNASGRSKKELMTWVNDAYDVTKDLL